MTQSKPDKILIVLLGAIGDVTRALPLAVRIKSAWPATHLYWAIEPRSAGVLAGHPAIDELIVFKREEGLLAFIKFLQVLHASHFDLVLDLQRHFKSGLASFATKAPRRIGFHRSNTKEANWLFNNEQIASVKNFSPKILQYQQFGDYLGLPPSKDLPADFILSAEEIASTTARMAEIDLETGKKLKWVAFVLGSTWNSRLWPTEHYVAAVKALGQDDSCRVVLVGGPAEKAGAKLIEEQAKEQLVLNLVGQTSLRELTVLLSRVSVVVAPDCGPMHIAAAVGTPVVSLWGATSPKRSAPWGSEHLVLQTPLGCSPCYRRVCPGLETSCMTGLSPEAVFSSVKKIIG